MKLLAKLNEVTPIDDEIVVGCLVRSNVDPCSTGVVVEFLSQDEVFVLWSRPPKLSVKKFGEIW